MCHWNLSKTLINLCKSNPNKIIHEALINVAFANQAVVAQIKNNGNLWLITIHWVFSMGKNFKNETPIMPEYLLLNRAKFRKTSLLENTYYM